MLRHSVTVVFGLFATMALEGRAFPAKTLQSESLAKSPKVTEPVKPKSKLGEEAVAHSSQPDSAFATSPLWENNQAEILDYRVQFPGNPDGQGLGRLTTKLTKATRPALGGSPRGEAPRGDMLTAALTCAWPLEGREQTRVTVDQFPRHGALRLLRQDQSIFAFPAVIHRTLDCHSFPPQSRVLADDDEEDADTALAEWPVYTEEMLFTYLRALPQHAGYREDAWILPGGEPGRYRPKAKFATITVRGAAMVRDVDTWYVTVDVEDAGRMEYWVSANGLHPVVMAILSDRTTWILQGMERRKFSLR